MNKKQKNALMKNAIKLRATRGGGGSGEGNLGKDKRSRKEKEEAENKKRGYPKGHKYVA